MEKYSQKNTIQISEHIKDDIEMMFPNDFYYEKNPVKIKDDYFDEDITGYFLKPFEKDELFEDLMRSQESSVSFTRKRSRSRSKGLYFNKNESKIYAT